MNFPLWIAIPVGILLATATWIDVRTGRIPNMLSFPALVLGLVARLAFQGSGGLVQGLEGALLLGAILFPGWRVGWMGAGDVKLMAAVGAWLGLPHALFALLATLIAGGVVALVTAARTGNLRRTVFGAARLGAWVTIGAGQGAPPPTTSGLRFPFAIAIFLGTSVILWGSR